MDVKNLSSNMKLTIVDIEDTEIEVKDVRDVDWKNDIYRVGAILLRNSRGEILTAQRALDKPHSPGLWGPSAAGMVESHETYESNVLNETEEELGLTLSQKDLRKGPKIYTQRSDPPRQYFMQWYYADYDWDIEEFVLQKDEVAAVQWISKEKLTEELVKNNSDFVELSLQILEQ